MLELKLRELYLDYVNNYLTIEKFASDNMLSVDDANILVNMGRRYHVDYVKWNEKIAVGCVKLEIEHTSTYPNPDINTFLHSEPHELIYVDNLDCFRSDTLMLSCTGKVHSNDIKWVLTDRNTGMDIDMDASHLNILKRHNLIIKRKVISLETI